jgi:hypothetical protein
MDGRGIALNGVSRRRSIWWLDMVSGVPGFFHLQGPEDPPRNIFPNPSAIEAMSLAYAPHTCQAANSLKHKYVAEDVLPMSGAT